MTTDELRIILRINGASTYTHTINEVTNVTNNYNKSVGNLMSTLTKLVSVGAIVKFGKQCLEAASNLQEVQNVVDVTFGSMSKQIDDWAKSQAASFGLSEKSAKEYASRYGTMAKQFGMTTQQAAAMGTELTKLTGDVASFYNITDSTAATKLKAIFTGETEGLKELGVVMTQAQLDAYAMQKGWSKTTSQMTEQEKVVLRYQYTMEKLSHAQGDFSRTSDSYANSLRTFKLDLENFMVETGKELLPVAAQGLQAIGSIVKAVAPTVIAIAKTIHLYAEAWKNASERTKNFAKIAVVSVAAMWLIPKVVLAVKGVVKLLTMELVGLNGVLAATAGIIGILAAALVFSNLSKQVAEMKNATADIANLGDSADASTSAVDDLADSLDGLGESSKGLDTFLASFDEVNKVGGGGSLMSGLVTADDLANILDASLGIEDLQSQLDSLHMPSIIPEGIFTKKFWTDLGKGVMGFLEEVFFEPGEFWADWKRGFDIIIDSIESVGEWLDEVAPKWSNFWQKAGFNLYDASHDKNGNAQTVGALVFDALLDDGMNNDKSGSFTAANGVTYAKYGKDGQLSSAYEAYIRGNTNKTVTNNTTNNTVTNNTTNNTQQPVVYSPNILIDGTKITSVVVEGINAITRSSGNSPLVEMGG